MAVLIVLASLVGQANNRHASDPVAFMRSTLAPIRIFEADSQTALKLEETPAFRLGKQPADNIEEGAIFFWSDATGRPHIAAQVFEIRHETTGEHIWIHEFICLAPKTIVAESPEGRIWTPKSAGVEPRTVHGAPAPASTPAQRDRQMRDLAREFHASDHFKDKSWTELRLLPRPVARFGKAGDSVSDGALFAFVTGTDPEAFLFLEVREGPKGPAWHYSFAPMTCWELKGSHGTQAVWTSPNRYLATDRSSTYYNRALIGLRSPGTTEAKP